MPRLVELHEKYEEMGVTVVSIDRGTRTPAAEGFLEENGVRHLVLNDSSRDVFEAYKVSGIPVTFVVDHAGRIIYRHLGYGPGDEERMAKEIETLVAWRGDA